MSAVQRHRDKVAEVDRNVSKILIVTLVAFVAWANLGYEAHAQGRGAPPGGSRGEMRGRTGNPTGMLPLRQLDLTDAQRQEVRAIFDQNQAALRASGEQLGLAKQALHEVVTSDWVNESEIRVRAEALGLAEGDGAVVRADLYVQLWQILTSVQQVRAEEIKAEMKASREDRRSAGEWMRQRRDGRERHRRQR
ncbi:MAG TPA: periplasmic heavy metal sensor [Gammaproteobacteria bacterium]|nr:periplasmic heavy metal sensor [Gammaproteobacteria bacterium]